MSDKSKVQISERLRRIENLLWEMTDKIKRLEFPILEMHRVIKGEPEEAPKPTEAPIPTSCPDCGTSLQTTSFLGDQYIYLLCKKCGWNRRVKVPRSDTPEAGHEGAQEAPPTS